MIRSRNDMRETFSRASIAALVSSFYSGVRSDATLGPIFEDRVSDWPTHLERMTSFWAGVLRAEPGYRADRGSPREIHRAIPGLGPEHYDRWLELFEASASAIYEPWAVDNVVGRARRMATVLVGESTDEGSAS